MALGGSTMILLLVTTSWHNEVTRGRHDERQHNLIVFWVQTESTGKVAAMVIARIEQNPENFVFEMNHR